MYPGERGRSVLSAPSVSPEPNRASVRYHVAVLTVESAEHTSCFRAGNKGGNSLSSLRLQGTKVEVLLARLYGASPSLPKGQVKKRNQLGRSQ
jgi:hypothetical protein